MTPTAVERAALVEGSRRSGRGPAERLPRRGPRAAVRQARPGRAPFRGRGGGLSSPNSHQRSRVSARPRGFAVSGVLRLDVRPE